MAEKGSSEGYVFFNKQRKNWNAQYSDYDENGKIKKKTKSFKTEKEAYTYLKTIMYQKENPLFIEHHGIPIGEVLKSNAKLKLDSNQIGKTQYLRILKTIDKLCSSSFGNKNLDKITTEEIQNYLNSIKYLSNSSISKIYQQLNQAFKIGINKGYIMRNPMANVIRPRSLKEDKLVRALTLEEQQKLTDFLINKPLSKFKYRNALLLQMYMGLRIGEALALTTHDIDLKNKKINIHRTLTTDENGRVIMGTTVKTYAGKRILPIPSFILPYIIEQMQIANKQENNEEKLLFKPDNSTYAKRVNINTELKRILKKEFGITDISTHSLRHTYGTRCIESRNGSCCCSKINGS